MKKTLMALIAVATLAVRPRPRRMHWRGGWGPGIGLGILGGAIVGGASRTRTAPTAIMARATAITVPAYAAGPGYYGACYWQRQRFWDGYGWRVRRVRVCG